MLNKFLIILAVIFLSANFALAAQDVSDNFVVAKVNNKIITNLELQDRYRFVLHISKININSALDKKILLNQVIDKMIEEELIRQEAASLKIEIAAPEIQEAIESVALSQKKNATQFKFSIISKNLSFENYVKQIESELLWSKIISETLRSKVKINEAETKEFFEQQKFNINFQKFLIAEIVIPKSENALAIATKLVSELRNGADFKNIVKQFSGDSLSAENNGEIGWVSQQDINAKVYEAISKMKKGEYSNPILAGDGYYIFKLINTKTETKIEDHDMSAARNIIFSRKLQTLAKGYIMDLRKKAFIEIARDKIEEVR